jgi:hypothetical protein
MSARLALSEDCDTSGGLSVRTHHQNDLIFACTDKLLNRRDFLKILAKMPRYPALAIIWESHHGRWSLIGLSLGD